MKKILIVNAKKKILIPFLFLFVVGCSDDPSPIIYTPPEELFLRDGADTTLIPLLINKRWNYNVSGTEEKPIGPIRFLLDNDTIEYIRLLPVRIYDNNEGWGKYDGYQALCYVTAKHKVFFYMYDKIYVGRHLQTDNYGFESVMWDYELPIYCTENSSRYFVLNRKHYSSAINEEDYLHEMPGYHTINVKINSTDYREYTECKLFQFRNKQDNITDPIRINKFYFKQGKGLIRYQQFVLSHTDSAEVELYTQDLMEDF
jgi:hypothetical protein